MIFSAEEMDEVRMDLRRTGGNVNLVAQLHACSAACIRAVQNGQTLVAGRRAREMDASATANACGRKPSAVSCGR